MENTLIFASEKEVQFGKLLKFIIPTYLTSLFNTVYRNTKKIAQQLLRSSTVQG